MSREIEFKFHVENEAALDRFASDLGFDRRALGARLQQNHFFDSADGKLRAQHLALRLRIESGHGVITVKGKAQARSEDAALLERFEAETRIPLESAQEIVAGSRSLLEEVDGATQASFARAAKRVHVALGGSALTYIGGFENERTTLPPIDWPVGERTEHLVFELDRTTFPGERIDCEIELEIPPEADAKRLQPQLYARLQKAGVKWSPAPSKLARFLTIQGIEK